MDASYKGGVAIGRFGGYWYFGVGHFNMVFGGGVGAKVSFDTIGCAITFGRHGVFFNFRGQRDIGYTTRVGRTTFFDFALPFDEVTIAIGSCAFVIVRNVLGGGTSFDKGVDHTFGAIYVDVGRIYGRYVRRGVYIKG